MLTKILFTALVIGIVYLVFHARPRRAPQKHTEERHWATPQLFAYVFIGVLVTGTSVIYYLAWRDDNRIVNIKVINGTSGISETYQAFKKSIDGRRFETLDGRSVTLGTSDRIELIEDDL